MPICEVTVIVFMVPCCGSSLSSKPASIHPQTHAARVDRSVKIINLVLVSLGKYLEKPMCSFCYDGGVGCRVSGVVCLVSLDRPFLGNV